ncbi:MAG: ABC transporter ATP-binding protein [Acidimicrobiia bacterium]
MLGQGLAEPAVELVGIEKRFGDVTAVDRLDLTIEDGEFFSLLGPSGCGKTTTLRMVAGLEFPTSGSVRIFGQEMGLRPPNRRPVNTVFQSYALFPHMTVAQNVRFGLEMRKVSQPEITDRVARAIDLVRLRGMEGRSPRQLSGGQQQRVALARALVNEPQVLLLDEPLGALDLKLRQAMQLELKELQERVGITFVYVTHDQEEALTMSDRIGVMDEGRLLQVGRPEEIYERPTSRFVADFIGQTNFLPVTAAGDGQVRLPDGASVRAQVPGGYAGLVLALRPEKIDLMPADAQPRDGLNRVAGTVRRTVYMGDTLSYEVECAGVSLTVRHENAPGTPRFAAGEPVMVVWAPEAARTLEG